MSPATLRPGATVRLPAFGLLGYPAAVVTIVARNSPSAFTVRYPDGRVLRMVDVADMVRP